MYTNDKIEGKISSNFVIGCIHVRIFLLMIIFPFHQDMSDEKQNLNEVIRAKTL